MKENSLEFLRAEGISERLIEELRAFRSYYHLDEAEAVRVPEPLYPYYGREVWEEAIGALLAGEHLLLSGGKASGKNVLAEGLAAAFGRPLWDISLYVNADAASLIGTDTFRDGAVQLRKGPVLRAAESGGFGILDEINMAKNESLAVLHAALDFRRVIDIPGYERVCLHEATRFIGTMNYGYAGTRELNEALASRFLVIQMPVIPLADVKRLLSGKYPNLRPEYATQFAELFDEIRKKSEGGEITSRALDLRGLIAAIGMMERGLSPVRALRLGIVNKCFDSYEQTLVSDLVATRLPESLEAGRVFA